MLFWIIVTIILLLLIFFLDHRLISIVWVILALLAAFRYNVGTDYFSYSKMFDSIANGTASGAWLTKETGYVWLIYAVDYIGGNFQLVCAIMSILTFFFMYKGFRYLTSDKPSYMVFVTFLFIPVVYFYTLNFIRQALVVAIFLYIIRYIVEKKVIKFIFFVFFAFMFHKSAVVLLPLYWVLNCKPSKKILVIFVTLCVVFLIYNPLDFLMNFYVKMDLLYSYYFTSDIFNVPTSQIGKIFTVSSVVLFVIFASIVDSNNKRNSIIINAMMLFLLIRIISIEMKPLNRIAAYFNPFFILFFVLILDSLWKKIKNVKLLLAYSFFLASLSFLFVYVNYLSNKDGSYNQYAFNICVVGKSCPVQVYGNYRDMYFEVGK